MAGAPQVPFQFGKYQLVERLGRGGMAEVWKAQIIGPMGFSRTLVLKRILPHLSEDAQFVQMFVAEALLSARLSHPNIVQVFELGEVEGEYFLAMEYVRGCDLFSLMRQLIARGAPPAGMGAYVVREVCRALAYAHALTGDDGKPLGLIHRDVSPSNVMITFEGAVKLLDFGIAKALNAGSERTATGTLKGKLAYMAPEQAEQSVDVDHRADLFAAGVVLHESLTGRRLFKAETEVRTLQMVREADVIPPSVINPDVPPELDAITLKALARDREQRYATCDEMAMALDEAVAKLKWGPERLSGLVRKVMPMPEPTRAGSTGPVPKVPVSSLTVGALRRSERRRWIAYGSVALATVGVLAWVVFAQSGKRATATGDHGQPMPSDKHELPGPNVETVVPPVIPPPVEQPRQVTIEVDTKPSGAEVWIRGEDKARGKTPVSFPLERSDDVITLELRKAGYQKLSREIVPTRDKLIVIELPAERVTPATPARRPAPRPVKRKPSNGELVDPFDVEPFGSKGR